MVLLLKKNHRSDAKIRVLCVMPPAHAQWLKIDQNVYHFGLRS